MKECLLCGNGDRLFALVVLAVLFGGFYLLSTAKAAETPSIYLAANWTGVEHNTISTSGSANEKVSPDMLTVYYAVETEGATAKEAQQKNAEIAGAVNSALKALGIDEKNIRTLSYSVDVKRESHYICSNESGKSDCYWTYVDAGYVASHSFSLEMYDFEKSGEAVDLIAGAGGNVQSVSFGLKPETRRDVSARLLASAAAEAKKKAEAIAGGVGASVTKPLSISESYSYSPVLYKSMAASEAAEMPATAFESGTIDVSVSVSALFEIK